MICTVVLIMMLFLFQKDKWIGFTEIWVYRDTVTNETKGDTIVAFENSHDAVSAVKCTKNTQFLGFMLSFTMTGTKDSDLLNLETVSLAPDPFQSALDFGADSIVTQDHGADSAGELGGEEYGKGTANYTFSVGGRGRGGLDSKPWQQEGDWPCPNLRSVSDIPSHGLRNCNSGCWNLFLSSLFMFR